MNRKLSILSAILWIAGFTLFGWGMGATNDPPHPLWGAMMCCGLSLIVLAIGLIMAISNGYIEKWTKEVTHDS